MHYLTSRYAIVTIILATCLSMTVASNASKELPIGERATVGNSVELAIEPDLTNASQKSDRYVWVKTIQHPGATFLKIHFRNFNLLPNDRLSILNAKGREIEVLTGQGYKDQVNFWSLSSQGDAIMLRFEFGAQYDRLPFSIDRMLIGDTELFPGSPPAAKTICGTADFDDAICYINDTAMWNNLSAIAGVMAVGADAETAMFCTGFLVSAEGAFMTNQHCVGNQLQCDGTEYVFGFHRGECNTNAPSTGDWQSYRCDTLLASEPLFNCDAAPGDLDFALTTVIGEPTVDYGYLLLDSEPLNSGDEIYLGQHPNGRPKEVSSGSGSDVVVDGTVIRYYGTLDTEGGSSGSPIIRASNNKVVGMHHCGGCLTAGVGNRGVRIGDIFPLIDEFLCNDQLTVEFVGITDPLEIAGDGDTLVEPGETWEFAALARNSTCTLVAGAATGQINLAPDAPNNVTLSVNALSFGDIDAGATVQSGPVQITIPTDATCGDRIQLDLSDLATGDGSSFADLSNAGEFELGGVPIIHLYNNDFATGFGGWNVVSNGTGVGALATWNLSNPGNRDIPMIPPFAIIDSDVAGSSAGQDEELVSPSINVTSLQNVVLQFTHDFNYYDARLNEIADVDVRSAATGFNWVNVARFQGEDASGVVSIDITPYRAFNLQVRFRYYNASYEWWWAVDDVLILGDNGFACDIFGLGDADEDGVIDTQDNCTLVSNPSQLDTDSDNFGNACDPDLNNDNVVNFLDVSEFSNLFNTTDELADFNEDGAVNFLDFSILSNYFLSPPGPSGTN